MSLGLLRMGRVAVRLAPGRSHRERRQSWRVAAWVRQRRRTGCCPWLEVERALARCFAEVVESRFFC